MELPSLSSRRRRDLAVTTNRCFDVPSSRLHLAVQYDASPKATNLPEARISPVQRGVIQGRGAKKRLVVASRFLRNDKTGRRGPKSWPSCPYVASKAVASSRAPHDRRPPRLRAGPPRRGSHA